MQQKSVFGFLPSKATGVASLPLATTSFKPSHSFEPNNLSDRPRSTSLSFFRSLAEAPISTEGLTFGWVVLCAAMTPYVIQLFAPKPLSFFLANYYGGQDIADLEAEGKTDEEIAFLVESGRVAEVEWKVRFASLGLVISTLAFFEVNGGVDAVRVLRDSYIAWAIFYVDATLQIRRQALSEPPVLKIDSRLGIQAWHILVTVLLWASITETYTGNAIRTFVTDVFTF